MKVFKFPSTAFHVMELDDISEPDAPKAGRLLAAVEYAPITSIYGER